MTKSQIFKDFSDEEWVDIKGYEGLYQISNFGRVKSLKINLIRKPLLNRYLSLILSKDGVKIRYYVHRLVAIHFISNPENKPEVNHKDWNPENNYYKNLEWVTRGENNKHTYLREGRKMPMNMLNKKGYEHPISKPIQQYDLEGNFLKEYGSVSQAAEQNFKLVFKSDNISRCARHLIKTAYGFIWKFRDDNKPLIIKKSIKQYSIDGKLIKIWYSFDKIKDKYGIPYSRLKRYINNERQLNGFIWKYN